MKEVIALPHSVDIKKKRKELGLTLEQVAKHVGVSEGAVRKWEKGHIKGIGSDKIAALAKILELPISVFIDGSDSEDTVIFRDELAKLSAMCNRMTQITNQLVKTVNQFPDDTDNPEIISIKEQAHELNDMWIKEKCIVEGTLRGDNQMELEADSDNTSDSDKV